MKLFHRIAGFLDRIKPSVFIRARVEPYVQIAVHRGFPLPMRVPNTETIKALRQARKGVGLNEYADLEALKSEHG